MSKKKVINLNEHAHQVLKKSIGLAEQVVSDIQDSMESQLSAHNKKLLNERLEALEAKLISNPKTPEEQLSNLHTQVKIRDVRDALGQTAEDRFQPPSNFEESEFLMVDDFDDITLEDQDEILSELEKKF